MLIRKAAATFPKGFGYRLVRTQASGFHDVSSSQFRATLRHFFEMKRAVPKSPPSDGIGDLVNNQVDGGMAFEFSEDFVIPCQSVDNCTMWNLMQAIRIALNWHHDNSSWERFEMSLLLQAARELSSSAPHNVIFKFPMIQPGCLG